MKYPIRMQSFNQIRQKGNVYADKPALVYDLATNGKIYFLSRPRRFGKSLLISTLKHCFLGLKELFKGLAIEAQEKEWYEYPVVHLSSGSGKFTQPYVLVPMLEGVTKFSPVSVLSGFNQPKDICHPFSLLNAFGTDFSSEMRNIAEWIIES